MKTEATSLMGLPYKKINAGLQKLQAMGVTPDRWLRMIDAHIGNVCNIASSFTDYYAPADVRRLLGVQCEDFVRWSTHPSDTPHDAVFEDAHQGFQMVVHYGGWTAADLRKSQAGKLYMSVNSGYDGRLTLPQVGCYKVEFSDRYSYCRMISGYRYHEWERTPGVIAATALLLQRAQGRNFAASEQYVWHCAEKDIQIASFNTSDNGKFMFYIEPPL